jgi:hypothetical protein
MRLALITILLVTTALALAGCGGTSHHSTRAGSPIGGPNGRGHAQQVSGHGIPPPGSPAPAARTLMERFARAYGRELDGVLGAEQLPDCTLRVRRLASLAGTIPRSKRVGLVTLRHARLTAAFSRSVTYALVLADREHSFPLVITMSAAAAPWAVTGLTPPDLKTVFAPEPCRRPQTGPRGARAAARTFLEGWLLYEYGHAKAAVMKDATPTFKTVLTDYPPGIPPTATVRHLYGRVVSLALVRRGSSWRGLAHITDGQESFDEIVQLMQTGGRWLVDLMIPPNQRP